tara:strand:- start:2164 stop:2628 length:465 start_codon:yes stop_codon:yes gene_type:complete
MKKILSISLVSLFLFSCSSNDDAENNLKDSEKFLKTNLSNADIVQIEPGLQYKVLSSNGNGLRPNLSDEINADFHGTLIDGSVFWSSIENGEPLVIMLSQLIPGCQKALSIMEVGETWRVFIHPDLAYGEEGRPGIPPNSLLIFDISLNSINSQ